MKQTAVEKLVEEINKLTGLNISMDEPCVKQAKEVEIENLIESYRDGRTHQQQIKISRFYNQMAKDYVNETFNKEI